MERIYNFSAGPSMLPEKALRTAAEEMLNYKETGMSVMEMSHRSKAFEAIIASVEQKLREAMSVPDNYRVLFLQGGASQQFAMVPMNLLGREDTADYLDTGSFARNAIKEAKLIRKINVAASSEQSGYTYIPENYSLTPGSKYLHITLNNTIEGTCFTAVPDKGIPVVADMSSNILSEKMDVSRFGLIYAGAQKNLGPAGVTVVLIRDDLINSEPAELPMIFRYAVHAKSGSMYNTPPTYAIYMVGLVLDRLNEAGGVEGIGRINRAKAQMLYDFLDSSELFMNNVNRKDRSIMNVTFKTASEELDDKFIKGAEAIGMTALKGHRSVGGMRASIYNAMPAAGVEKLVTYMKEFEKKI